MTVRSLEEVAQQIFGPEDPASVERWVQYWGESEKRNSRLLEPFQRLVLLDFHQKQILDIGCGTGGLGSLVSRDCELYVGGNYHRHVLQFAHPGPHRCFVQCNGTGLPFQNQVFDYIFAFDVIEHLVGGISWQIDFLKELRRTLQPLGMIFLTTPNFWYPYEGHTNLYFPQYLPASWRDRYIRWRNPGFLREHNSFSAIKLLTPRRLRECLKKSRLTFLHDLPCGLDRKEFVRHSPLRGQLAYPGLGWYLHAEFWGILVRQEDRSALRLKLLKNWHYRGNQLSQASPAEFKPLIDFGTESFAHQLAEGWYCDEGDEHSFRWMTKEASCYLESRDEVRYLRLAGYSPHTNHLEVWVDAIRVGEHAVPAESQFQVEYLIPFQETSHRIFQIRITCTRVCRPENARDRRQLGLMIFSIGLV